MATTQNPVSVEIVKGPYQGAPLAAPYRLYRASVVVNGVYSQSAPPSVDLYAAFQLQRRNITGISVLWCVALGDYYDGTNAYTPANSGISLSSSGSSTGNVVAFRLHSGASNGATGSEIANGTGLGGAVGLLFGATVTTGSGGIA